MGSDAATVRSQRVGVSMDKQLHKGEDGLTYDDDGHFVYTGISPLSEEEDVAESDAAEN